MNGFFENLKTLAGQVAAGLKQVKTSGLSSLRKAFSLMGKKEKIALISLLTVALASLFWSGGNFYLNHTRLIPDSGGVYTEGMLGQPMYLNPLLAHQEPDLSLIKLVYSGLYKYDANGQLAPDLAVSLPEISADQKQYTIKLKNNVKWHNGRQFTANDVVFTIQTLKDAGYKSPLRSLWLYTGVEKLGDYEVRFTTADVSGPFANNLTLPILPEFVWGNVAAQNFLLTKANLEAIGTGPYAIKEIKKVSSGKIQSITMESFTDYYGGRPKIDTVIAKFYDQEQDMQNALHSREISGFGFTPYSSNLKDDLNLKFIQTLRTPLPQYQVAFFNLNNPILADLSVRQALAAATDKQQIIKNALNGQAIIPASPLVFGSQTNSAMEANGADIKQAQSLLDKAGWVMDAQSNVRRKKNQELALTISTNDLEANSKAAENLANQWQQLGIKVILNVLPTKQLTDTRIRPRNFDVLLYSQIYNVDPDPFSFWHSSQIKDPGLNLTGFNNPAADKLITEARTTTNLETRKQKYAEFNRIISQNIPALFLNQSVFEYILDKNVKNVGSRVIYAPSERLYDLPNWYINQQRAWK